MVDLRQVVEGAAGSVQSLVCARNQSLELFLPDRRVRLKADPARLHQVVANLLVNASKYTHPGGRIVVACEAAAGEVELRIQDNGAGIDAEHLEAVFELFRQVHPELEASRSGYGVGLALVKELVEMHGGSVRAYSAGRGCGSEFVVRLPL